MKDRIARLVQLTMSGNMFVKSVKTEYSRNDIFLPDDERDVKRLGEYLLNQEPLLTEDSLFTGYFRFDGSCVGDAFSRAGHKNTSELLRDFYCKPVDNISTLDWQHATADYQRVLEVGINGLKQDILESIKNHNNKDEISFLNALYKTSDFLIAWAHKCSQRALEFGEMSKNEECKKNMKKLSESLKRVPEFPPRSFYEAVLMIYVLFAADPDSIGTLDRNLYSFYVHDIDNGIITREEAKEYLQELFLELQAKTDVNDANFTRGGESHFCVGGYLPNGEDGFTDLSKLIIEAIVDMPIYCPEVTLRWTKKLNKEDFKFVLDAERHDKFKRIAFTNDEKRIECYTKIVGIPFEKAIRYTMVGCNEPAFPGSIAGSTSHANALYTIARLFNEDSKLIENAKDYEEFYSIFIREFIKDFNRALENDDRFNLVRAKDKNYISSLFFNGPIQKAKSVTQGGCDLAVCSFELNGIANTFDSLSIVYEFVFEKHITSLKELIKAIKANWKGYELLHMQIIKNKHFFGNDDKYSNYVSQRLVNDLYQHIKDKRNVFGYHILLGDLLGYRSHHQYFGSQTLATPDGRYAGENLGFCLQPAPGRNKEGFIAILNTVSKLDPNAICCGNTVTNITVDKKYIEEDEYFEKMVDVLETYFKNGGVHFQLNYYNKEELIKAKQNPAMYQDLRVRVTGFSDYFVKLDEAIQDDILRRD